MSGWCKGALVPWASLSAPPTTLSIPQVLCLLFLHLLCSPATLSPLPTLLTEVSIQGKQHTTSPQDHGPQWRTSKMRGYSRQASADVGAEGQDRRCLCFILRKCDLLVVLFLDRDGKECIPGAQRKVPTWIS